MFFFEIKMFVKYNKVFSIMNDVYINDNKFHPFRSDKMNDHMTESNANNSNSLPESLKGKL